MIIQRLDALIASFQWIKLILDNDHHAVMTLGALEDQIEEVLETIIDLLG